MSVQPKQNQRRLCAVAVRDADDLLLVFSICRDPHGDVYVNFPRDHDPAWKPHSSYHASGQHHQKSYGHKALVYHRQRPDVNLRGTVNVVTLPIASNEPRAINTPCQENTFKDVVYIPLRDVRSERYRTFLSVDVTDSNGEPTIAPGAAIIRQAVFKDAVPWVLITLFDTGG
jgi:hypothetical protein